ncbi:MAG TPA: polysaccharide biosynthesis protein, partial [Thermotogales bacterium]|nr:polysaccharide biosynthesis protein [Thermotogales bacterium]
ELTDNRLKISQLRDLSIEDLVGRQAVSVNMEEIRKFIEGKKILVTGAGGSIGSEICRQLVRLKPKELILLGRGENSIYSIYEELSENHIIDEETKLSRVIADVSDQKRMRMVFEKYEPDVVFHAAAHKHVDLMEENPVEAFKVNSFGTKVMADLSIDFNVERFVFISTDKAVKPSSIMGLSKRFGEIYIRSVGRDSDTKFGIVRFGNVIGSRGSVLLKFKRQIEKGGPVTITDPRMKRFFMSIPEAVALVLQTVVFAEKGDLFVLDMGELIPIEKIARDMIILAGYVPDRDIKIVYTGIRPGEKLTEELFLEDEIPQPTSHPKIMRVEGNEIYPVEEISRVIEVLLELSYRNMIWEILKITEKYVPDHMINKG